MTPRGKSGLVILGTLLIGILIGALGSGALRQTRRHRFHAMPPDMRFLHFVKRVVQPTPEQEKAFDAIIQRRSRQIAEINEQHETQILAIFDSLRTELSSLLTDEQRVRLEERLKQGISQRIKTKVQELTRELSLTEVQQEKIEAIFKQRMPGREIGRPPSPGGPPDFREHMRTQWEKIHAEIEAVLTPEQREKYQDLKHRHRFLFGPESGPHFHRGLREPGDTKAHPKPGDRP